MKDNTAPDASHAPVHPSLPNLARPLDPWDFARLIETETRLLLSECFPGWTEHAGVYAYEYWRRVCQEMLLHTLTLVCDTWRCLRPEREAEIMTRPTARGLRIVVSLTGPDEQQYVHLYETVLAELRRPRSKRGEPGNFTLLDTLRREYNDPDLPFEEEDLTYAEDYAWFYADSWTRNLLERVSWGQTDPYFEGLAGS